VPTALNILHKELDLAKVLSGCHSLAEIPLNRVRAHGNENCKSGKEESHAKDGKGGKILEKHRFAFSSPPFAEGKILIDSTDS